jgi:starch synthase
VVIGGETGRLVRFDPVGPHNPEPKDPDRFARDLAAAINEMLASPGTLRAMGEKACHRVTQHFGWTAVAEQTLDLYKKVTTIPLTLS